MLSKQQSKKRCKEYSKCLLCIKNTANKPYSSFHSNLNNIVQELEKSTKNSAVPTVTSYLNAVGPFFFASNSFLFTVGTTLDTVQYLFYRGELLFTCAVPTSTPLLGGAVSRKSSSNVATDLASAGWGGCDAHNLFPRYPCADPFTKSLDKVQK